MLESLAARRDRLGPCNGFGGLRLLLAAGIFVLHSYTVAHGTADGIAGPVKAAAGLILPAFFALSGYLVASSLARSRSVFEFLSLRLLRVVPALAIVTVASALLLGPLVTTLSPGQYFRDPAILAYLANALGQFHHALPGVFEANPRPGIVNGSLWTIQQELLCYGALAALAAVIRKRLLFDIALCALALLLIWPTVPFLGLLLVWLPAKPLVLAFMLGALMQRFARQVPVHPAAGIGALSLAFIATGPLAIAAMAYAALWLGMRHIPPSWSRNDYSYGLYLAGYPLQQLAVTLLPAGADWYTVMIAAGLPALACAALLWHMVEQPILLRKFELIARMRNLVGRRPVGRALKVGAASPKFPPRPVC